MDLSASKLQVAFRNSEHVRHFFFYPTIGSTNDKAKELAERGAEEWTLVVADCQTAGRGRSGRHWYSPPLLGLYVSFLFRPRVPVESVFGVHMAVSLAAAEAAEAARPQGMVGIKWPNDVVAEGRKLAGILSEVGLQGGAVSWCVVGLGLNVNHTLSDFPEDLRAQAMSLRELCLRRIDRTELLLDLVRRAGLWYGRFQRRGMGGLLPEWTRRSTILDREVRVETAGEVYVGTAVGLAPDGALVVRLESGTEEVIRAGDVNLLQYR